MSVTPQVRALARALQPLLQRVRTDVTAKKVNGKQLWTNDHLTDELLHQHLNGGPARGVGFIQAGENTTMAALFDLDSHKGATPWPEMVAAASRLVDAMATRGWRAHAFRSSGGRGLHLLALWSEPQDAASVRAEAVDVLAECGFTQGTKGVAEGQVEFFPKQNSVPLDGYGNQVILPFAGKSELLEPSLGFEVVPRDVACAVLTWDMSDPVPLREPEQRRAAAVAVVPGGADSEKLRAALAAIPNDGAGLDYDEWVQVMFGVAHGAGEGGEGLALAHEFSARSVKYNPEELDRKWPSFKAGGGVTVNTVWAKARAAGWNQVTPDDFEVLEGVGVGVGAGAGMRAGSALVARAAGSGGLAATAWAPGGGGGGKGADAVVDLGLVVPPATTETSHQANVHRLLEMSKGRLLFVKGRWHWYGGTHWSAEAGARKVAELLARLPKVIEREVKQASKAMAALAVEHAEHKALIGPLTKEQLGEAKAAEARVKGLLMWKLSSEMRTHQEAVEKMARGLFVPQHADQMDADPWAWNTVGGTLDVRTGELRPHSPADFITKLAGAPYDPGARCPRFVAALGQMFGGDEAMVRFIQVLVGYGMTGSMREHILPVLVGVGSNGKSTLLDVVARVLGSYQQTAAPGLLVGKDDRHPTELADLQGTRLVVAHETNEGARLREGVIKQVTGGDRIRARRMYQDFYEFSPTSKVWLVTNHKPVVVGQDNGIWRRLLAIVFPYRFGSPEQVAAGEVDYVADKTLGEALQEELAGVQNFFLEGARLFAAEGLKLPRAVIEASAEYRQSQDRVRMFVRECCEVGMGLEVPLTDRTSGGGLYPAYSQWCKESGHQAMSKVRFLDELRRVLPAMEVREGKTLGGRGAERAKIRTVYGVRLLETGV